MRAFGWVRPTFAAAVVIAALFALGNGAPAEESTPVPSPTSQADEGTFKAGDLAVTGFSGTSLASEKIPAGVDPLDRTLIDPSGPALRVFDASNLSASPTGKLVDIPLRLDVPARQIGQVFGLAFDDGTDGGPPNLYAAATSMFGINIVGAGRAADGQPVRLKTGAPDAAFMEGQFGALSSQSPGAIYKIDGATGAVSYFADTAFSGKQNSGPGIGGLAYDPASRSLYASDLDTGAIHRFGLDYNAADLSQFDHGVAGRRAKGLDPIADDGKHLDLFDPEFKADDPATWGITQASRRVDALAVHDGRLYYAVADGPEIWSVGINGGSFAADARLEVKVKAQKPLPITAIAFDGSGRMYLAQRGTLKSPYDYGSFTDGGAEVLRYVAKTPDAANTPDLWEPDPAAFAIGMADDGRAADGGVSPQYGYKPEGTVDANACDASVAMTGDTLLKSASGVQLNSIDLVRPANAPPTQSAFIDYDQRDDDGAARGHVGNVIALRKCGPGSNFPPVEGGSGFPPVEGGGDGSSFPPVDGGSGGGGSTLPPVEGGDAGGGGQTFPPVEDGGGGTTTDNGGGGQTAEAGGVSITKSAGPGTCTEKGGCSFNIDVTNNSGKELPEIIITDEMTAGAANLAGAKIEGAPPAPWTCTAPPKFSCKRPGPIADGETVSLPLSFAPTGIGQEKELKNCASKVDAATVEIPQANGLEINGLKVEAKAVSGSCAPGVSCEWEIIATNTGAVPLSGELELRQGNIIRSAGKNVQPATLQLVTPPASPGTTCKVDDAQKTVFCNNPNTTIAPGASQSFKFTVKTDPPPGAQIDFFQSDVLVSIGKFSGTKDDPPKITSSTAVAFMPLTPPAGGAAAGAAAPVGPVCATLPVEQPDQPKPDAKGQPKLSITKTGPAECSDLGGCDFSIAIKNGGDVPFNGPVTVAEEVTLDGKSVPGALIVPNQTWTCTPGPTSTCTSIPQMKIGPQGTATLRVKVIYTAPTGAKAMQNCASVPGQTAKACASVPLIQGPKLVLKKEVRDGVCDPNCTFRITAKNIGNADFPGPIKIVDFPGNIKSPSGTTDIKATVVSATMVGSPVNVTCTKPGNIACVIGVDRLAPGIDITFDLTMKTQVTDFTGDNCVLRTDIPIGNDNQQVCVPMHGERHKGPNLLINKEAPNATSDGGTGHCGLTGLCTFQITIKNIGDAPFTGVLHLKDTVGPGVPVRILKGGGFGTCTEAQNSQGAGGFANNSIDCDIGPFPEGIRPNDSVQLEVLVEAGRGWGSDKNLNNCAELSSDADMGPAETAKKDCADAKLDPFDVDVVKTGDQSCRPGSECRFDIDIFNPNPTVTHDDPVTVTDKLSGLSSAQIVSITGAAGADPFPCSPAPTQIPFTCTGHMNLKPGEHNHYTMIVRLPADSSAASFSNCASVGGERSSGQTSDESCHSVQLAPPDPFTLGIEKTGPASCAPGSECAFDITITNTGSKDHSGAISLTDGLSGAPSMSVTSVSPPMPCTTQPTDIPFSCKTPDNFTLPAGGKRTFRMTARIPRSSTEAFTNCAIIASATAGDNSGSRNSRADETKSSCVTVQLPQKSQAPQKVECKGGMVLLGEGECACPAGTTWNGRQCATGPGSTTPSRSDVLTCPPERPNGTFPNCCPRGTLFEDGACRQRNTGPGNGRATPSKSGDEVVCPRSRPVGAPPNCCPTGTRFLNGACHPVVTEPPRCPTGMVGDWPKCCPRGTLFKDGACRRRDTGPTDDGANPSKSGGDISCPRSRPIGTPPNCCPRGTKFLNGVCRSEGSGGSDGTKPSGDVSCPRSRPIGTPPNCCPRGTKFLNGVCRSEGSGGSDGTKPGGDISCPRSRPVGTPPNCCPRGTKFLNGVCRSEGSGGSDGTKPGDTSCPRSRPIGTPPNCCPVGTHLSRSKQCVEDAPGKATPSKTETQKCTGGRVGTPPNCFCPPPRRMVGGRCRFVPKPTAPPPAPKPDEGKIIVR